MIQIVTFFGAIGIIGIIAQHIRGERDIKKIKARASKIQDEINRIKNPAINQIKKSRDFRGC